MWHLPGPGIEPASPASAGGFFTTEPPGKPSHYLLDVSYSQGFPSSSQENIMRLREIEALSGKTNGWEAANDFTRVCGALGNGKRLTSSIGREAGEQGSSFHSLHSSAEILPHHSFCPVWNGEVKCRDRRQTLIKEWTHVVGLGPMDMNNSSMLAPISSWSVWREGSSGWDITSPPKPKYVMELLITLPVPASPTKGNSWPHPPFFSLSLVLCDSRTLSSNGCPHSEKHASRLLAAIIW